MKSILYAVNNSPQTVTTNGSISFGQVVRRSGNDINMTLNPLVSGSGFYNIDTNIVAVATGTGLATITLYENGNEIPGAKQSVTVGTTGNTISFSIPAVIKKCCCLSSEIKAVLTGAITSASVTNATIVIEKV